jgi:hypothetical protein
MTTVVISQPMYFPWVGFAAMAALADIFVWLDDVQFSKGSFTNRVQVLLPTGPVWMTVPLAGKGSFTPIRDLRGSDAAWPASHRALLAQSFRHRPHGTTALETFERAMRPAALPDRLVASCTELLAALDAKPPRVLRAADVTAEGSGSARVLDICRRLGATRYVSGAGGARYLDHWAFDAAGIAVEYMVYDPLPWPQGGESFTPYVTGLDLLASRGAEARAHLNPRTQPWRARLAAINEGAPA